MDKLLEGRLQGLEGRLQGLEGALQVFKGRSVPLYATVSPLDIAEVIDYSPVSGRIRQLSISWPDGCNFIVLVSFGRNTGTHAVWLVPGIFETFERNNDTTITYPLDEPVTQGEKLWLIVRNGDIRNPHQISATVIVAEVTEKPLPIYGLTK